MEARSARVVSSYGMVSQPLSPIAIKTTKTNFFMGCILQSSVNPLFHYSIL
jgi:hypothetical protein